MRLLVLFLSLTIAAPEVLAQDTRRRGSVRNQRTSSRYTRTRGTRSPARHFAPPTRADRTPLRLDA